MQAMQFTIAGSWAHFKKPETNNNPLTHEIIPKTALVGMIGAVLGKERSEMKALFPQLCEDIAYGVQVTGCIQKITCGFTARRAIDPLHLYGKGQHRPRKAFELLKDPLYLVALALRDQRSSSIWELFLHALQNQQAHFTPVLGLHNCPANLKWQSQGTFSAGESGDFRAKCFVSRQHKISFGEERSFRIGFDRIPTWQNNDFWNPLDRYVEVIYPAQGQEIKVHGEYYQYSENGENWWLI